MSALLQLQSLVASVRNVCDVHCLLSVPEGTSESQLGSNTVCYRFNRAKAHAYLAAKVGRLAAYLQQKAVAGPGEQRESHMSSVFCVGTSTVDGPAADKVVSRGKSDQPDPAFMTQALELLSEDLPDAWTDSLSVLLG